MTRKSKREIERVVEKAETETGVGYVEMLRYLERVADEGREAPLPCEHFGEEDWGPWVDVLDEGDAVVLPSGLDVDVDELTPVERFGIRYLGPEVRRGILDMRLGRGRSRRTA